MEKIPKILNMNFWENVDAELDFKGMNRKSLAQEAQRQEGSQAHPQKEFAGAF